jgi:hypothetical protein
MRTNQIHARVLPQSALEDQPLKECIKGTAVYMQHVKMLADLDRAEREESIALGLSPQNLGAQTVTQFHFVSHVPVVFPNKKAALAAVAKRDGSLATKMHVGAEDDAIRDALEAEFSQGREQL